MNAKLATVEAPVVEPPKPTPREVLVAAHERVKVAEETLSRVRDRKRDADNARWTAKKAAEAARKAVAAAQVVDPAAILEAMRVGADPTADPTAGLGQARAEVDRAEAALVEADRQRTIWDGVVSEAEKGLQKAKLAYETASIRVWQPVQAAIEKRIRDELEAHQALQQSYRVFAWNLRTDPHAAAPI